MIIYYITQFVHKYISQCTYYITVYLLRLFTAAFPVTPLIPHNINFVQRGFMERAAFEGRVPLRWTRVYCTLQTEMLQILLWKTVWLRGMLVIQQSFCGIITKTGFKIQVQTWRISAELHSQLTLQLSSNGKKCERSCCLQGLLWKSEPQGIIQDSFLKKKGLLQVVGAEKT
jgi:hypothetical protein